MKQNPPTVDELNAIQTQWMALDPHAPKPELDRVCALMKKYPRTHLSVSDDGKTAMPMIDGMPAWAHSQPTERALEWVRDYGRASGRIDAGGCRIDVAWCGSKGQWVKL